MKILIVGFDGQLGQEINHILKSKKADIGSIDKSYDNVDILGVDQKELDIRCYEAVKEYILKNKPDIIINCAAYTNVDGCEENIDAAFMVNAIGAKNLAVASNLTKSKLIHISTDYVFGDEHTLPIREYEAINPSSIYGKTKALGEKYVSEMCSKYFIVRTSWLYGLYGNNFVKTIIKLAKNNKSIKVVDDQKGNPTYANDLAYEILKIVLTENYGIYHCTGNGECTWYDFARNIVDISGLECEVLPCTSEQYKTLAKRPKYSSLDNMMLRNTISDEMREWKEALKSFLSKQTLKINGGV